MKKNPLALGLTALIFVLWIGFLGFQVSRYRTQPVVVSRAQLLEAKYDVVADLQAEGNGSLPKSIKVVSVTYAADALGPKPGQEIVVENLGGTEGYDRPGRYILPLDGRMRVAGYPFDPGRFSPDPKPRIYPVSPSVEKQFADLRN